MRNVSSTVGTATSAPEGRARVGDLQRDRADHLPDPGFDPVEVAEDHLSGSDPVGGPALVLLDRFQDHLEAVGQVGDDVIVVARFAMVRVEDCRRAADEHGSGNQPLKMGGGLQQGDEPRISIPNFPRDDIDHNSRLSDPIIY